MSDLWQQTVQAADARLREFIVVAESNPKAPKAPKPLWLLWPLRLREAL